MWLIAMDGVYLAQPQVMGGRGVVGRGLCFLTCFYSWILHTTTHMASTLPSFLLLYQLRRSVVLTGASRADVVLRCEDNGEFWLRSTSQPENEKSLGLEPGETERRYDGDILKFVVDAPSVVSSPWVEGGAVESMDLTQLLPAGVYPDLMNINQDCDVDNREVSCSL